MIEFIVYEKNIELKNFYERIIHNFLGKREENFKVFDFGETENTKDCRNIYILSSQNCKEILDIARKIRKNDDWNSQIILISNFENAKYNVFNNRLGILDYINSNDKVCNKLKLALYTAYKILNLDKTVSFILNNEVHKIPYYDILYIEKSNNQNYCLIHTEDKEYRITDTIKDLEEKLDPAFFFKTHRSCIVNIHNIISYNCNNDTICFKNKHTDMVARERKKLLKNRLAKEE